MAPVTTVLAWMFFARQPSMLVDTYARRLPRFGGFNFVERRTVNGGGDEMNPSRASIDGAAPVSFQAAVPTLTTPAPVVLSGADPIAMHRQLAVVREMIRCVDTLTEAGRRHMMSKVAGFLEPHLRRLFPAGRRPAITRAMAHLARESERARPDARAFRRRAELLVTVIGAATAVPGVTVPVVTVKDGSDAAGGASSSAPRPALGSRTA
jgi:hypothetical protein